MSARHLAIVGLALSAVGGAACNAILGDFDIGDGNTPDGGGGAGVDAGATGNADGGSTVTDAGRQGDAIATGDGSCVARCVDPSTLDDCVHPPQACPFECSAAGGGAHCTRVIPTDPVSAADLDVAGTIDVTLAASTRFVVETGAIENVRPGNKDAQTLEVSGGIGFHLAKSANGGPPVGIWSFKSLTVPDGVTVRFTPGNPAAIVASGSVVVAGVVDARGYDVNGKLCVDAVGGPGGGPGGAAQKSGVGPGAGRAASPSTSYSGGPSGGAFGGTGGGGGTGNAATNPGAIAPTPYGTPALLPLIGGSGGGGAFAAGGGGGGAIQIVAGARVVIGGGAAVGGVNAGGCNGHGGSFGSAGSAGGSGGAILVETPALDMKANGVLAANGGAGATGGGSADPSAGQLSSNPAFGAIINGYGYGGNGGAGTTVNGGNGTAAPAGASGAGGAGGGAVGRIRINNRSGSFTPPAPSSISPALGIAPNPPSTVGVLDVH